MAWMQRGVGDEHEFRFWDLEGKVGVALTADGHAGRVATDRDDSRTRNGGAAGGASRDECAGKHVRDSAADEVKVAGTGGVGVHEFGAEGEGEWLSAFGAARGSGVRRPEVGNVGGGFAARTFDGKTDGGELEELDAMEFQRGKGQSDATFYRLCG